MKITNEFTGIANFEAWSGAIDTKETIVKHNKESQFDSLIEELYWETGISDVGLNDLLWHDSDWVYEMLNIEIE